MLRTVQFVSNKFRRVKLLKKIRIHWMETCGKFLIFKF